MVNVRKVIMSMCVIMVVMCLCVGCSYSQDKPSEKEMQSLIMKINKDVFGSMEVKRRNNQFINEFISKHNGRYCIEVAIDFVDLNNRQHHENIKYSFEKKGNRWYGWHGWGPGEEGTM